MQDSQMAEDILVQSFRTLAIGLDQGDRHEILQKSVDGLLNDLQKSDFCSLGDNIQEYEHVIQKLKFLRALISELPAELSSGSSEQRNKVLDHLFINSSRILREKLDKISFGEQRVCIEIFNWAVKLMDHPERKKRVHIELLAFIQEASNRCKPQSWESFCPEEELADIRAVTVSLDGILSTMMELNSISLSENIAPMADPILVDFFLHLITCVISSFTASTLLPKLLKIDPATTRTVLERLWLSVVSQVVFRDSEVVILQDSIYTLLCSLVELYFQHKSSPLVHHEKFWQIIQCGIVHHDQAVRKQARYLFKRAIDFSSAHNVLIITSSFTWDPCNSKPEDWDPFFLFIESMEEKQIHLIKPMFPLIDSIFKKFDETWGLCALQRVVNHDNRFIVKWGLQYFLKFTMSEKKGRFFLHKVIPVLNNGSLYLADNEHSSDLGSELKIYFNSCADDKTFFKSVIPALGKVSWAPLPLYQVTQGLGYLPRHQIWNSEDVLCAKTFLKDALACQSIFLRGAIQSMVLRCFLSLADPHQIDLVVLTEFLSTFKSSECFDRTGSDWQRTVNWMKISLTKDNAEEFYKANVQVFTTTAPPSRNSYRGIARMTLLLFDSNLLKGSLQEFLSRMIPQLENCQSRPYLCLDAVDTKFQLLVALVGEWSCTDEDSFNAFYTTVFPSTPGILTYLQSRLTAPLQLQDYHAVLLYSKLLKVLSSCNLLRDLPSNSVLSFLKSSIVILNQQESSAIQKYFAGRVMEWACNICRSSLICPDFKKAIIKELWSYLTDVITSSTLNLTSPRPEGPALSRDLQTLWGHVTSGQLKSQWSTLADVLIVGAVPENFPYLQVVELAQTGVEIGGPETLPYIMRALKNCIYKHDDAKLITKILNCCYRLCFEQRKNENFWLAMEGFVFMTFSNEMLERQDLADVLIKLIRDLHAEGQVVSGLFNLLVKVINTNQEPKDPKKCLQVLTNILVLGVTFGPVPSKEQKLMYDTYCFIESMGEDIPINVLKSSKCHATWLVRWPCLRYLLVCAVDCPSVVEAVAKQLLQQDRGVQPGNKSRYFADSYLHKIKFRTVQTVLILEKLLSQSMCEDIFKWACNSLVDDIHQPSVRYLLEWLIVRLLLRLPGLKEPFLEHFKEGSTKRQGSVPSFVSILYLWIVGMTEQSYIEAELIQLSNLAMELILPWCMAQQYNIRLYAQVALLGVLRVCRDCDAKEVTTKFAPLQRGLETSLEHGCAVKNAMKLQEEFYFSVFRPIKHFTIETIFCEIPRLSNVSRDEWDGILKYSDETEMLLLRKNADDALKNYQVANWILKSTGGGSGSEDTKDDEDMAAGVVQRKVQPWKSMFPEQDAREHKRGGSNSDDLIVVASLVDKAPNLGGLSRTCEVLAASELVLASLRITEDPLFQSLSVSAEKWITLSEVKPDTLPTYLSHMRDRGYTLVAAEQTSRSVPLQEMKFPKKTLLLLGNEKEGIPAELLPLLDVCVEVPQHGVVRSLNVHVTGALFIWQYFKQHRLLLAETTTVEKSV